MSQTQLVRCEWVAHADALFITYHDHEWGLPSHDERHLFEMLNLEGAQAGLSWSTILRKRQGYRDAFARWDVERVATFGPSEVEALLQNPGIVRNRAKIEAAIANAQAALKVREELGSLAAYLWEFVGGQAIQSGRRTLSEVAAETVESRTMSKDLKRRGFKFVGPTTCYAFMQAAGLVNDHTIDCFRYKQIRELA
jgi:DNA-3-methyladenine glycosylase I